MFNKEQKPRYVTEGSVKEIIDEVIRSAMRVQARDLEKHLNDIHKRLLELEKK